MEKEGTNQLELFSQDKGYERPVAGTSQRHFFGYIRGHEKALLFALAFIVVSIVSFSLGVEKGKGIALTKADSRFDTALKTQAPKEKAALKTIAQTSKQEIRKEEAVKPAPQMMGQPGYTIQLASYKTNSYAQKEAEALKKKGLSPLVMPKGSYIVLYVGNFANRETAQSLMSELKKRFQDCRIIRRL